MRAASVKGSPLKVSVVVSLKEICFFFFTICFQRVKSSFALPGIWLGLQSRSLAVCWRVFPVCSSSFFAAFPALNSMRTIPSCTFVLFRSLISPTSPVRSRWVPPQASTSKFVMSTTRILFPGTTPPW